MFFKSHFSEVAEIASKIDFQALDDIVQEFVALRNRKGRLFFLGVGGSAGNCGHAVNDFRKLCGIESYAPTDNVSELTARTNDEGWASVFSEWLKCSNFNENDALFIFSVGGGSKEFNISANLVESIDLAKQVNAKVFSIVGKDTGYAYSQSNISLLVPIVNAEKITPHSEAFQAVIWHSIVSHPDLKIKATTWESVVK